LCKGAFKVDGINTLLAQRQSLTNKDENFLDFSLNLSDVKNFTPVKMHLRLYQERARGKDGQPPPELELNEVLAKLFKSCRYTAEPGEFTPQSWESLPWKPFMTNQNDVVVQFGALKKPYALLKHYPKLSAPVLPFPATDSFRSLHEARIKLAYAANGEFVEDKIRLQNLCNAMHKVVIWQVGSTNVAVAAIKVGNFVGLDPKSQVPIRLANGQKVELEWTSPKSQHMQEARAFCVHSRLLHGRL
jgi:hypothetical protein